MLDNMNSGSIIYDLAAVQGGNTSATKVDEVVVETVWKLWVNQTF